MGCPPEGGEKGTPGFYGPRASVPLSQRGPPSKLGYKGTWMKFYTSGVIPGFFLFKIQPDILIEHLFTELRCPCLSHTLLKAALRKWKKREKNFHRGKRKKKGSGAAGHDVSSCSGWLSLEKANRYSEVRKTHCRNVFLTNFFSHPY